MAVKLLWICLLLVLLGLSCTKEQECLTSASNCNECIQSGPECAWCTSSKSDTRCHTLNRLRRTGCPRKNMYKPLGGVQVVKNHSSSVPENSKAIFLQPQELSLHLRPGLRQSFLLTITMPSDELITEMSIDTSPVPEGVNISFISIENGNPKAVQVNVEAAHCPSESADSAQMDNRTGPWVIHITPRGFSLSVKLDITLECQCACTRNRVEKSSACGGNGDLVCGQCECHHPYTGKHCQTNTDSGSSANEVMCRQGPNAPVCSGRGKCVDGFCECDNPVNPEDRYSGRYCECSDLDCPYIVNRICGGRGKCACGECFCEDGWTGKDCSCSMETTSCMAHNQMLCNGKGMCRCGTCVCDSPYRGLTCEHCPTCQAPCVQYYECVECLAFGTGGKKDSCDQECGYLSVTMVETKRDLTGQICQMRSQADFCLFYYTFSRSSSGRQSTVARAKDCPRN